MAAPFHVNLVDELLHQRLAVGVRTGLMCLAQVGSQLVELFG
ncbi:MAG: hypothetical protein ACR2KP_05205 [Egibacteraceae bacterium]